MFIMQDRNSNMRFTLLILFAIMFFCGSWISSESQLSDKYDPLAMAALMNMMQGTVQQNYQEGTTTGRRFLLLLGNSVEQGIFGGIQWGIVNCMSPIIKNCIAGAPTIFLILGRFLSKQLNRVCKRPDPLDADEVSMWGDMVENIAAVLCDQVASGNLVLRNIRVREDADEIEDANWQFFVAYVDTSFSYIIDRLHSHLPYYEEGYNQQRWIIRVMTMFSSLNNKAIIFTIHTITTNLDHLRMLCKSTVTLDDVDIQHVKGVVQSTLLLFKKLRILITCDSKCESRGILNSVHSNSMNNGIIDY